MLILTRRPEQGITVTHTDGTELHIVVLAVKGNQVRIGFTAPPEVAVYRDEVLERMREDETGEPPK